MFGHLREWLGTPVVGPGRTGRQHVPQIVHVADFVPVDAECIHIDLVLLGFRRSLRHDQTSGRFPSEMARPARQPFPFGTSINASRPHCRAGDQSGGGFGNSWSAWLGVTKPGSSPMATHPSSAGDTHVFARYPLPC